MAQESQQGLLGFSAQGPTGCSRGVSWGWGSYLRLLRSLQLTGSSVQREEEKFNFINLSIVFQDILMCLENERE